MGLKLGLGVGVRVGVGLGLGVGVGLGLGSGLGSGLGLGVEFGLVGPRLAISSGRIVEVIDPLSAEAWLDLHRGHGVWCRWLGLGLG